MQHAVNAPVGVKNSHASPGDNLGGFLEHALLIRGVLPPD